MDKFIEFIQEEFEKILKGPGVTWNKDGMLAAMNKALIIAMARYAKLHNVSLM